MTRMSGSTRASARPWTGRFALASLIVCAAVGGGLLARGTASADGCAKLSIPSIGIERCVVDGGQSDVDAGRVARIRDMSSPTVSWLAGHRVSHGGTFRQLTNLRMNAPVEFRGVEYRVVEYRLVDLTKPWTVDDLVLAAGPTVILQTSAYGTFVHVWRATELAVPTGQLPDVPGDTTNTVGAPTPISVVAPTRILDTRETAEPFAAWQQRQVGIPADAGIPATATVAFVNITVIGRGGGGFLTTYACAERVPDTSSLNWSEPWVAVGNLVVVPLVDGTFCGVVSSPADVVIDLVGYGDRSSRLGFNGALEARLLDTRTAAAGVLRGVETRRVSVTRQVGDEAGQAVEVTLTGHSSQPGYVTVHPCDVASISTSSLNLRPGMWIANSTVVGLDSDGGFCVTSHLSGASPVDVVIDLHGSFSEDGALFQRLKPVRLVDTRRSDSSELNRGARGSATAARLEFPGSSWRGLPTNDGLVVNVTTAGATRSGYVTVWRCAMAKPTTAIQNPRAFTATASTGSIGDGGRVCVQSLFPVHLVVDVYGAWVRP